jgi:hypothetical protein
MPPKPKRKRAPRDPVTVREGQDCMIALLLYRDRVAEAERTGKPIAGIKAADAKRHGIPF